MADHHLDARGLRCPLPVLRARKALMALEEGEVLRVEATDPGAPRDVAAFCASGGHRLRESSELGGVFRMVIEKGV